MIRAPHIFKTPESSETLEPSETLESSETLAETFHALSATPSRSLLVVKRQGDRMMAALVAISMLLGSATPSQADRQSDNIAKALAAALAIGLVASAINHNNRPKPAPAPQPQPYPQPRPYPQPYPHHQPKPAYQPRVPATCAIEMESSQYGTVTMYPERCLRSEGFNYRLPDCGRSVRIYGQPDWVYSGQCLRDAGFQVER